MKKTLPIILIIFSFIHIDAQNWNEVQKIVASDRGNDDIFGATVAISNNYAVVGAFLDSEDANGENTSIEAGSAYIFERDPSGIYNEVQKIVASDRDSRSFFSLSISIDSNYILLGAPFKDEVLQEIDTLDSSGVAYLFKFSTNVGIIENDFGSSLVVFPKPTNGEITIDLGQNYNRVDITVRDIIGHLIFTKNFETTSQINFEIGGSSGFYLVEIKTTENKSAILKVVKK